MPHAVPNISRVSAHPRSTTPLLPDFSILCALLFFLCPIISYFSFMIQFQCYLLWFLTLSLIKLIAPLLSSPEHFVQNCYCAIIICLFPWLPRYSVPTTGLCTCCGTYRWDFRPGRKGWVRAAFWVGKVSTLITKKVRVGLVKRLNCNYILDQQVQENLLKLYRILFK